MLIIGVFLLERNKSRFKICKQCGFQFVANNHKEYCTKACYSDYRESTKERRDWIKAERARKAHKQALERSVIEDEW